MEDCNLSCSYYNCKRTYTNAEALHNHLQDHQKNPALSLPGKSFLCSTIGCDGSFSNMQQLMDHMRHHHKPNYFFLCESCRAKLRSYRTLLKHLQTCAKVAKSKAVKTEGGASVDGGSAGAEMDTSVSFKSGDFPRHTEPDRSPPFGSASEHAQTGPGESAPVLEAGESHYQHDAPYSPIPPSLSPAPEPEPHRSPRTGPPGLGSSPPHTPPGSNAVWRKNQDCPLPDPPAPVLHRWNSPQALSREDVQASPLAIGSYGSTLGGAIAAFSVDTLLQSAKR